MLDCPKCGFHVDGLECGRCGHKEQGGAEGAGFVTLRFGDVEMRAKQCAHWERGQRCGNPGTLSETTHAKPDTDWYCRAHYKPFAAREYARHAKAKPEGLRPLEAILKPVATEL